MKRNQENICKVLSTMPGAVSTVESLLLLPFPAELEMWAVISQDLPFMVP